MSIDFGWPARRPSRTLWLRVSLGLILSVGAFSLVGPPRVLGEGSADLEANGGKRALTEWRTSLYGSLLPRRTLFRVYLEVGEEIALGSSGVGVGSGDIVGLDPRPDHLTLDGRAAGPGLHVFVIAAWPRRIDDTGTGTGGADAGRGRLHAVHLHGGHDRRS